MRPSARVCPTQLVLVEPGAPAAAGLPTGDGADSRAYGLADPAAAAKPAIKNMKSKKIFHKKYKYTQ